MAVQDDARDANDLQQPTDPNHVAEIDDEPLLSTPPGEPNGLECKTSRKREREVSLEPATPQAASQDIDPERPEGKERRTPAKKNRTSDSLLEAPQEEAEDDAPANGSPPHETKIRQISQGVEDITWQNMKKEDPADPAVDHAMEEVSEAQETRTDSDSTKTSVEDIKEAGNETTVPPLLQGENPPILNDTAGDYEDNGAAAGAEHPADSHIPGAPEPPAPAVAASSSISTSPTDTQVSSVPLPKPHRRDSDSSDQEKGLKRKLGDRTVSESLLPGETVPGRNGVATVGATKRPRDDAEADPNTREKKRPTPPPEEEEKEAEATEASTSKLGGFMAYASTSSPFASVPGPRLFGGKQPSTAWTSAAASSSANVFGDSGSTSPFASSSASPSPFAAAVAAKEAPTSSATASSSSAASPSHAAHAQAHAHKRTGFEAFASSTSPFASAAKRPKSPPPSNNNILGRSRSPSRHGTPARATSAFSAYAAGGAQSFAAPTPKRPTGSVFGESSTSGGGGVFGSQNSVLDSGKEDEDSEKDSGVSFGERLRAQKDKEAEEASDEEKRLNLTEQEVVTGEEEEDTVYQVRGKLFVLSSQNQWKERGTGMLRLNVRRADGTGARLVMRKEAVYTVLLNATLFKGMRCFLAQDPRYLRFSVFEGGITSHYNLRVSNAKIAEELLEEINAHIPME
ncbi:hypothetical protein L227DRAFT_578131 [Lentinus tigrinus ALCF2SS1-6]|uniref:RanBD1 domain-containing protein n=1 Tax=Lentinus tigrinus ALCF2SS1-6 TaxID=1328759 RepID=A0A5C2S170_9APHY|nr:hypothetical protein L227DRAFT_578131 [Lentinus tigrinus ALCF2SS1-6]